MEQEARGAASPERGTLDLAITVAREEIATQSEAFDQLDTKTGVLLGFAMIAVSQVFSGVLHLVTEKQTLATEFSGWLALLFLIGTTAVLVATVAAVVQRLPHIYNNISTDKEDLQKSEIEMKRVVLDAYKDAAKSNESTLSRKAKLARAVSFGVGVALICLVLATGTFFFSIPKTQPKSPSSKPTRAPCELRVC
jgi:hypothetical protein